MADIRNYEGATNSSKGRELIGTIKPHTGVKTVDGKEQKTEGYLVSLMVNAKDERTQFATEHDPKGGSNLHLSMSHYQKDGEDRISHNRYYTKAQGDAMIAAAGSNNAPYKNSEGKNVEGVRVIAFQGDLVPSNNGLAVNTKNEMKPSEIESFGNRGAKASQSLNAQYDAMREASAKAKAMQTAERTAEAPEVAAEASKEAEAGLEA